MIPPGSLNSKGQFQCPHRHREAAGLLNLPVHEHVAVWQPKLLTAASIDCRLNKHNRARRHRQVVVSCILDLQCSGVRLHDIRQTGKNAACRKPNPGSRHLWARSPGGLGPGPPGLGARPIKGPETFSHSFFSQTSWCEPGEGVGVG